MAKTLKVKMLGHLSSVDPADELRSGAEYDLPEKIAERYYDFGIAEIIDPKWKRRDPTGPEPYQTATAPAAEVSAPPAMRTADDPVPGLSDELREAEPAAEPESPQE